MACGGLEAGGAATRGQVCRPDWAGMLAAWSRIAVLSFGGPAGQIAVMHRELVEGRRWLDEREFLDALNFCMLLPGPEAQQLATYAGWRLRGWRGGLLAGTVFIIPGLLTILALSWMYVRWRDQAVIQGVFYGLKPAVIALVLAALARLAQRAARGAAARLTAAGAFLALFVLDVPFPWIVVGAGGAGAALQWWRGRPGTGVAGEPAVSQENPTLPDATLSTTEGRFYGVRTAMLWLVVWLTPVALVTAVLGDSHILTRLAWYFSRLAVVTFGGAYAALAAVAQHGVEVQGWLTAGEMLDGLGLAETTPGPLILVVQFVGYIAAYRHPAPFGADAAGLLASLLVVWVTFCPSFLWIFTFAPYVERLRRWPPLAGSLRLITAAVVGVILNLTLWMTLHVLFRTVRQAQVLGPVRLPVVDVTTFEPGACLITVAAAVATLRFRLGMGWVLAGGVSLGLVWRWLG